MKILAPPTPRRHPGPAPTERPRGIQPARLGCAPGTSRGVLDTLMTAGTREADRRSGELMGDLRASVAQERAIYVLTGYVLDDTEAALAGLAFQLATLIKAGAGADHTVRMLLLPIAAQFAEQLPAAHSTWDHRPLNVAVGRELPAEKTAMPDHQWFDEPTPEQQAAAAQRDATRASWRGLGLADGTPPPMLDPFHEPGNPACGCTQCSIAAAVAPKTAADESWPFLYSPAQLDGTACARCGQEFAVNEPNRPVVTDECNEQFVHSDPAQCGPAVAPWNDADDAGIEAAR